MYTVFLINILKQKILDTTTPRTTTIQHLGTFVVTLHQHILLLLLGEYFYFFLSNCPLTAIRRANDNAYSITPTDFANTLSSFIGKLRTLYRQQPIFVFTPWGWPQGDGVSPFSLYYDGVYSDVVNKR
jgi:hypothetical protein